MEKIPTLFERDEHSPGHLAEGIVFHHPEGPACQDQAQGLPERGYGILILVLQCRRDGSSGQGIDLVAGAVRPNRIASPSMGSLA
jgi:hypothetical protein